MRAILFSVTARLDATDGISRCTEARQTPNEFLESFTLSSSNSKVPACFFAFPSLCLLPLGPFRKRNSLTCHLRERYSPVVDLRTNELSLL